MSNTSNSSSQDPTNTDHHTQPHPPGNVKFEAEQYHPTTLASDIYQGLGGMYAAAKALHLQGHKRSTDDYYRNVERSFRCGLQSLGFDPAAMDAEIAELRGETGDDDVDNSVTVQGDTTTHIHMAPGSPLPQIPIPEPVNPPQPKPAPEPQPPPIATNGRTPAWVKWALGAAIAGNLVGVPTAAYFASRTKTTIVNPPDRSTIGLTIE